MPFCIYVTLHTNYIKIYKLQTKQPQAIHPKTLPAPFESHPCFQSSESHCHTFLGHSSTSWASREQGKPLTNPSCVKGVLFLRQDLMWSKLDLFLVGKNIWNLVLKWFKTKWCPCSTIWSLFQLTVVFVVWNRGHYIANSNKAVSSGKSIKMIVWSPENR